MKRDNQPWTPADTAELCWDDDALPRSLAFDDIYYSRDDGLAESRHVFIDGNDIPRRLREPVSRPLVIGETGFGTGLNFLLTWQAWRQAPAGRRCLHFLSVERYPLTREDLRRALAPWRELEALSDQLADRYPLPVRGQHRLLFEGGRVILDLWLEDAGEAYADLAGRGAAPVDAWYLDGFAPARNADMWQAQLLRSIGALSRDGASAATFTAASQVRRDLASAGFTVTRVPGFGRKRESLRATLAAGPRPLPRTQTPWDIPETSHTDITREAVVIGAGLAGATVADALARRGIKVCVLDRGSVAGAASGNDQGVLYTRLSRRHSTLTDFALQSYLYARDFYRQLFADGSLADASDGALCGYFQQARSDGDLDYLARALHAVPQLARVLDAGQASAVLGINQPGSGYWFPGSGWLHPPAVCRALLAHDNIRVLEHCGDIRLEQQPGGWLACNGTGELARGASVIVAAGTGSRALAGLDWLPLQPIRGQTTQLPSTPPLDSLRAVLCHEGYIAPARRGVHCIGATFDPNETGDSVLAKDHRRNLAALAAALPACASQLDTLEAGSLEGRSATRCASPDYLPLVGPVPDREAFLQRFAGLGNNARQFIDSRGPVMAGLFISTGHGSRGLTSTPLAAEILASQIAAEPVPLSRHLERALLPARFLIRDLKRGRA